MFEVSIIIPVFNAQDYINETLKSVLSQNDVQFEVIVVDDCSTDFTEDCVKNFIQEDNKVRYLKLKKNSGGPASPRNKGIEYAISDWIAFCDSDDLWHPDKLKIQLQVANNINADFICTEIEDFIDSEKNIAAKRVLNKKYYVERLGYLSTMLKNRIGTSSVMCKKSILIENNFDKDINKAGVEDYDLWLRLLESKKFRIYKLCLPLVSYRDVKNSISSGKLSHAIKVINVQINSSKRKGWLYRYILLFPVFFTYYIISSIYLRIICKKL